MAAVGAGRSEWPREVGRGIPPWHPPGLGAAWCGGKSLPAGLGHSFHSWCFCFLAVGSEAQALSELHCRSKGHGHDQHHFNRGRKASYTKNVCFRSREHGRQKEKMRREGRGAPSKAVPSWVAFAGCVLRVCRGHPTPGGGWLPPQEEGRSRGPGRV